MSYPQQESPPEIQTRLANNNNNNNNGKKPQRRHFLYNIVRQNKTEQVNVRSHPKCTPEPIQSCVGSGPTHLGQVLTVNVHDTPSVKMPEPKDKEKKRRQSEDKADKDKKAKKDKKDKKEKKETEKELKTRQK